MTKIYEPRKGLTDNFFGHWCSGFADQNQWLQVSFFQPRIVTAVSLKGWVTSFKIQYSIDGQKWLRYNNDALLKGSNVEGKDASYVSQVILQFPITAAALRINPFTWNNPWPDQPTP